MDSNDIDFFLCYNLVFTFFPPPSLLLYVCRGKRHWFEFRKADISTYSSIYGSIALAVEYKTLLLLFTTSDSP